jgi:uncharacterized protein
MRLINQTKNITLAEDVLIANTIFTRIKGLLGKKYFLPNQALILDPCNCVHTFGMHFPIDILFIDKECRIIQTICQLKPNRISRMYWNSSKVIELPAGKLGFTHTKAGDQLKFLD